MLLAVCPGVSVVVLLAGIASLGRRWSVWRGEATERVKTSSEASMRRKLTCEGTHTRISAHG